MRWYWAALKKFGTVSGRASRKEFWMFWACNFAMYVLIFIAESSMRKAPADSGSVALGLYDVAILAPSIALGSRRMHDAGLCGWWYAIPVVNIVLALRDGQHRDNRYGPDPRLSQP